jgi:hypothetical protein
MVDTNDVYLTFNTKVLMGGVKDDVSRLVKSGALNGKSFHRKVPLLAIFTHHSGSPKNRSGTLLSKDPMRKFGALLS